MVDHRQAKNEKVVELKAKEALLEALPPHSRIPHEDMDWILTQSPTVIRLFLESWRSDSFGSRGSKGNLHWHELKTELQGRNLKKAMNVLEKAKFFQYDPIFEVSPKGQRRITKWRCWNMRGCYSSSWRAGTDSSELRTDNTELGTDNTELETDNTELGTDNTELGTDNTELGTDNTELRTDNTELGTDNTELPAETQPQQAIRIAQVPLNNYSNNFLITLSQEEREKFENFVREEWRKKTSKAGQPGEEIISLERFLAREEDCKNWYVLFMKSPAGKEAKKQAIATKYDWRNDPRFDDWIWKAWDGGYPWTQEDEVEREERYAFWRWAQDTNAYEGVCC